MFTGKDQGPAERVAQCAEHIGPNRAKHLPSETELLLKSLLSSHIPSFQKVSGASRYSWFLRAFQTSECPKVRRRSSATCRENAHFGKALPKTNHPYVWIQMTQAHFSPESLAFKDIFTDWRKSRFWFHQWYAPCAVVGWASTILVFTPQSELCQ